jgi:hypothetical protein
MSFLEGNFIHTQNTYRGLLGRRSLLSLGPTLENASYRGLTQLKLGRCLFLAAAEALLINPLLKAFCLSPSPANGRQFFPETKAASRTVKTAHLKMEKGSFPP